MSGVSTVQAWGPDFNPQHPCKQPDTVLPTCVPSTGKVETKGSSGLTPSQSRWIRSSRFSERTLAQKIWWRVSKEDSWCWTLTSISKQLLNHVKYFYFMFTSASLHSHKFTKRISAGKSTHCSCTVILAQEDLFWSEGTHPRVLLHTHRNNKPKK